MTLRSLFVLFLLVPALAGANAVATEHVTARLLTETSTVAPGRTARLLLVLDIIPHWHTYWRNPGDSGEPPRIDWTLPDGVEAGPLGFTAPERIAVGPLVNFGYSFRALHPVALSIPDDWPAGTPIPVRAEVHWLVCAEHCIPESVVLDLELPTAAEPGPAVSVTSDLFAAAAAGRPRGRIDAVLAGDSTGGARLWLPRAVLGGDPDAVWFYPHAWGLVEHAAAQPWQVDGDRLVIELAPGALLASAATDGLLVVTSTDGQRRSYEVQASRAAIAADAEDAAEGPDLGLPLALLFAMLGGLILNLMPCVFPVLAIKVAGLAGLAGQSGMGTRERTVHGLSYTAGVLVFFGVLAGLLLALRAGGQAVGWGFQLQFPPFVAVMSYLFLVLGLSLAGAVTLGGRLMGWAPGGGSSDHGPGSAFATGALAALVAAPCTAPFMGAAVGYAVTSSWPAALAVMLTLGLGLALPFLLLSLSPVLASRLPRPGPWMELMKQGLAFPILATSAWLLWVLSVQTGPDGVALVLTGMLLLALGLWVRERSAMAPGVWPGIGASAALVSVLLALVLAWRIEVQACSTEPSAAGYPSEPFSARRLAEARTAGRKVFVNMTAAWCITCLVNERVALSDAQVTNAFAAANVLYLKGDWTNRDAGITDFLAGFGRNGVPIYVVYQPAQAPRALPQILTPAIVLDAVADATLGGGSGFE